MKSRNDQQCRVTIIKSDKRKGEAEIEAGDSQTNDGLQNLAMDKGKQRITKEQARIWC